MLRNALAVGLSPSSRLPVGLAPARSRAGSLFARTIPPQTDRMHEDCGTASVRICQIGQGVVDEPNWVPFAIASHLDDALGEQFTRGDRAIIGSQNVARCLQHLPRGVERRRQDFRRLGIEEAIAYEQRGYRHGGASLLGGSATGLSVTGSAPSSFFSR